MTPLVQLRGLGRPLLLAALALSAASAWAQQRENKLEPPDLARYRRWGFLRARPGFELTDLGYDSNILYSPSAEPVSDFTATLTPKLDGLILFGSRAFLTFVERFQYVAFAETTELNYWNNRFNTRATVPFRNFGVFADLTLDNVKLRPVDLRPVLIENIHRNLGLGAIFQPGWRTEIELSRNVARIEYRDSIPPTGIGVRLDRDERFNALEGTYLVRGRTRAALRWRNGVIDFDDPLDLGVGEPVARDTREWRALAGIELGRGSSLTGSALVGWGVIDAEDPRLPDLSELVGEIDLVWLATSRTRLRIEGERLPGFAIWGGSAYYLDTHASVRGVHYLTGVFGLEGGYLRGRLEFPGSPGVVERLDEIRRYEVGVRLRLRRGTEGRRVEYSLTVGRLVRESNDPLFSFDKNTFGFGAVLGF